MSSEETGGQMIRFQTIVQTITLATMILGIAGMFVVIGRKDQMIQFNSTQITELRDIAQDLVKSQVLGSSNDSYQAEQLNDLKRRVDRLESK
tara:strand:- start:228 stop:503 length:276 start_codon:yes stop_codon:yes gene_type:complete